QISFHRSTYLERGLTLLYPIKIPITLRTTDLWQGEEVYEYHWPDKAVEIEPAQPPLRPHNRLRFRRGEDGEAYTADGSRISLCSYQAAALLEGLDPEMAVRLEAGRATLWRLRMAILSKLLNALR